MTNSLTQAQIDELTATSGSDWRSGDRAGFYVKHYDMIKGFGPDAHAAAQLVLVQAQACLSTQPRTVSPQLPCRHW